MWAIFEAKRAGLLRYQQLPSNLLAGVVVGIVALPLAMAFAIASGVRPEQGIYTAIIASLIVSVAGGSRVQIAGPTGAFIAILAGITARYGVDGLQLATCMAGLMLLVMGLANMGGVIKFIPAPVIAGFTAGIGLIIFVGQWRYFLGLPKIAGQHFHEQLLNLWAVLPKWHGATTVLGGLSLLLLVLVPRVPLLRRVPAPFVVMLVATVLQLVFHFEGVATIANTFGSIVAGLPSFSPPAFTLARVIELVGPAFAIAMLGSIESLLSAVVADGMTGARHNSNQELMGQGLANIVAPLFGGFAATGAIARTATNIRNGATSPVAGIIHALTLVLVLLVFAPWAAQIPLTALAAILFVVAFNMSDLKHCLRIMVRAPRADVVILWLTFGLTVFVDLVVAVNIGVIVAVLHFLRRMAASVEVHPSNAHELKIELGELNLSELPAGVLVYEVNGPFFFGAVENFERALLQTHTEPKILILRLRHVPFMDITGLQALEEVIEELKKRGVRVLLCEANHRVYAKLVKAGVLRAIAPADYDDRFLTMLKRSFSL